MTSPASEPAEIGARVRTVRRRRGLSLDVAAGLAGISKSYLSMLERGERRFERRGLLEDLSGALGCSVADLTGQPYLPADRDIAEGKRAIVAIETGLNDATLDDVPDLLARPLADLRPLVDRAALLRDAGQYGASVADADRLLIELQTHVVTATGAERRAAAELVVYAAYNAFVATTTYGYFHLAQQAARRAYDAALITERPELVSFAMFARSPSIARNGGRHRAQRLLDGALRDAEPPGSGPIESETYGLLHLMGAHLAARERDGDGTRDHLEIASELANRTGERNGFGQHFGPTNVSVWRVSLGAELDQGPEMAERAEREPIDLALLGSRDRSAALHFDMARAYAQGEGSRDREAVQHLDTADRLAPQRIRQDSIARDVLIGVRHRARRRWWELDSLSNRFGLN